MKPQLMLPSKKGQEKKPINIDFGQQTGNAAQTRSINEKKYLAAIPSGGMLIREKLVLSHRIARLGRGNGTYIPKNGDEITPEGPFPIVWAIGTVYDNCQVISGFSVLEGLKNKDRSTTIQVRTK